MTSRYYYNLKELVVEETTGIEGWQRLFNRFGISFTSTTTNKSLFNHLLDSCYFQYIVYIDLEHPYFEATSRPSVNQLVIDHTEEVKEFLLKIKGWLEDSQVRYTKLLTIYNSQENNLMSKVETITESRFNDTPQADPVSGFESDDYTSNYTESKNFADLTTVAARLEEVRRLWRNLMEDWQKEFAKKFIIN